MVQFLLPISGVRRVRVTLVVATSALLASASSYAQHDHPATVPPTSNPVTLKFDSVLSHYRPMTDQKIGSWRDANDTVTRVGGWRAYLKESQTPDAAAPRTSNKPVAPVPIAPTSANPHAGHGAKP